MASITDHIIKLQELTQTNLEILQSINDAFFAKQNHLSIKIGDNHYAIPSFISLENKLDSLTANFENLVKSPETGEAYFNFDGNSRSIQVRPYTNTPNSLVLTPVSTFDVENNDIFKDFMTPTPFVNINVQDLPNDIVNVIVKKVIPINQELVKVFEEQLIKKENNQTITYPSIRYPYSDLYKKLSIYKKGEDYIEYDSKISLPIRKNIGSGIYVIEEVIEDIIDENLDNYITIKFRSDMQDSIYMNSLKYRLFDETIEKLLKVGDQLTTYDGSAKVEITEIRTNTNTIVVKVLHGEYLNLVPSNTNNPLSISSLSKMKFYSPIDFNSDKFVKVPLEENKYVFIAIAALNDRMNVQSAWGSGLILYTDLLKQENLNEDIRFREYYDANVKNVGDILFEITSMMSNTITHYSGEDFNNITKYAPVIDTNNLIVTQINKHLNDSESVKNIRSLYSQKKNLQLQLDQIQDEINTINESLSNISFDDTTGIRIAYVSQLTSLTNRRNDISSSITRILNDISVAANNSEVPIENAKYRIRGFFDINSNEHKDHIKGIRVQYRYKNVDQEQGNAMTIDDKFIFSDWNNMISFDREKIPSYDNGYKFNIENTTDDINVPSFNQIDIPISQGETVDIRLKIVYDYGYPFICTYSEWSPIINIAFPEEYLKDVQLLDILDENNKDIESNKFINLIKNEGISAHVDDKIIDQDITYFHNPENIASGFYTSERRIIPLKDKLTDLNNAVIELRDEILGSSSDSLSVYVTLGEDMVKLVPYQSQQLVVEPYSSFITTGNEIDTTTSKFEGLYQVIGKNKNVITTCLNVSIVNNSDHTTKLFSLFPGSRDATIGELNNYKYIREEYCVLEEKNGEETKKINEGVWIEYPNDVRLQSGNQFMYFRIKDVNDGKLYYGESNKSDDDGNVLSYLKTDYKYTEGTEDTTKNKIMYLYPKLHDKYNLCVGSDVVGSYILLSPGEAVNIPIIVEYRLSKSEQINKTLSFDILPSLYKDPITYTFTVVANYENSILDKVIHSSQKYLNKKYQSGLSANGIIKYNSKLQ